MFNSYLKNTLEYTKEKCINCGMCSDVCPHGVFASDNDSTSLVNSEACMECGACELNCPVHAISVDSGVGCAFAMIMAALKGEEEETCGCSSDDSKCA